MGLALRYFANRFPELCLVEFMEPPPDGGGERPTDRKIFVNFFLLYAAIDAAYLDVYYPNEFHDQENGGPSAERHAAAVMAWLNRFRPIQVNAGVHEEWAPFINSFLALHVGLTIKMKMGARHGIAEELIEESGQLNDLIYMLHWRSPDYKQLTTLLQFVK